MSYDQLADFIRNRMRMSHIYQPVMLMTLLQNKGSCHEREIANAILAHDESQIDYYTHIVNNMVGRVLRGHELVQRDRKTKHFRLVGYEDLSSSDVEKLIELCVEKSKEYVEQRGAKIWSHRKSSSGYISGTLRYEVLKRAKFHCELCGIPADQKALEVDHIIPRNKGGTDDRSNLQALCYSCNAMKRDRDDTDFRAVRESYKHREESCVFCDVEEARVIAQNELLYAIRDNYPVTELHTLLIPKRHVVSYFDLGQAELNASSQLLAQCKEEIKALDAEVDGFNIGVNDGETAGQTVFHCHIHVIPRRKGDVADPRGGVRHTMPGMGYY